MSDACVNTVNQNLVILQHLQVKTFWCIMYQPHIVYIRVESGEKGGLCHRFPFSGQFSHCVNRCDFDGFFCKYRF